MVWGIGGRAPAGRGGPPAGHRGPTLVVNGECAVSGYREIGKVLAPQDSGARHATFRNSGHMVPMAAASRDQRRAAAFLVGTA